MGSSPDAPSDYAPSTCATVGDTRTPSLERPSPVMIPSSHSSQFSSPRDSTPDPQIWTRSSSSDEMEYEQDYRPPTPKQTTQPGTPSLKSIFVSGTGCEKSISGALSLCQTSL